MGRKLLEIFCAIIIFPIVFLMVIAYVGVLFPSDKKIAKANSTEQVYATKAYDDLKCLSALSTARDMYFDKNNLNGTFRAFTSAQDKIFLKYDIGHGVINTKNIDKTKQQSYDTPITAYGGIKNYCDSYLSNSTISNYLKDI